MLQKSDSYYYSPPYAIGDALLWLAVLTLIFVGIFAIVRWVVNFKPAKKKDEKTVRDEIKKIFKELKENAAQFKRDELIPSLLAAEEKVTAVLEKKGLLDKT